MNVRWPVEVAPEERPVLGALLVLAMLKGTALVYLETPAETLFLVGVGAANLPYVYIVTAVVASVFGLALARAESRWARPKLILGIMGLLLLSIVVFYVLLVAVGTRSVAFGLMVWREVFWTLLSLSFWVVAGGLFDLRQGKRLFGLLNAGEVSAMVLGGLSVPVLVPLMGTQNLLLVSGTAMAASVGLLVWIFRTYPGQMAPDAEDLAITRRRSRKRIQGSRYLRLFFVVSVLSVLSYFLVDFIFYDRVQAAIPDETRLATFFGTFFAAYGILQIISSLFVVGPVMTRYGVGIALLALPVADALGTGGIIVAGIAGSATLLLVGAVGTKLMDEVTRNTLSSPAERILYQAIPGSLRFGIQALKESVVEPMAMGLAGLLLLVITVWIGASLMVVVGLLAVVVAGAIWAAVLLKREYPEALSRAIATHRILPTRLEWTDSSTLEVVEKALSSSLAGEVIYGLEVLERLDEEQAGPALENALDHHAAAVRRYALDRLEALGRIEAMEKVEALLEDEASPVVLGAGVRCLAALRGAASGRVLELVRHPRQEVQDSALVGLLRSESPQALAVAEALVQRLSTADDAAERIRAARIIGEGRGPLADFLESLLEDPDGRVRAAAAEAARAAGERFVPVLADALGDPEMREGASASLVRLGAPAVGAVEELVEDPEAPPDVRRRAAWILGQMGEEGSEALLGHLQVEHEDVRDEVLRALARSKVLEGGVAPVDIRPLVGDEVERARWTAGAYRDVAVAGRYDMLVRALREELGKHQRRVLDMISLAYPSEELLEARSGLRGRSSELRAQALELLETILPRDLGDRVLPLAEERWSSFAGAADGRRAVVRLNALIAGERRGHSPWLRATAAYEAGRHPREEHLEVVTEALGDGNSLVRETAAWAALELDPEGAQEAVEQLRQDGSLRVRRAVYSALATEGEDRNGDQERRRPMPLTVERVIILKTVSIFREIPEEYLVELADSVEEVETVPGDEVIRKGEGGSDLYIIVRGRMRVHDGERFIAELGPREVFGELAALDPEVRSASVTAEEEGLLFRVSRRMLYDLMAERTEVARGIIAVLCRRIRNTIGAET